MGYFGDECPAAKQLTGAKQTVLLKLEQLRRSRRSRMIASSARPPIFGVGSRWPLHRVAVPGTLFLFICARHPSVKDNSELSWKPIIFNQAYISFWERFVFRELTYLTYQSYEPERFCWKIVLQFLWQIATSKKLTFNLLPPRLIVLCLCSMDHLSLWVSKSVYSFAKVFTSLVTDERTDRQIEYIMPPPASLVSQRHKMILLYMAWRLQSLITSPYTMNIGLF